MDGTTKAQFFTKLQGSKCDVVHFFRRRVHQGTQLEKCQTNMGHSCCYIRSDVTGKEEQTQSSHL